ncbi:MAG: hypothetical protein ACOYYS_08095 [Chloroflexota bacterium]
MKKTLLIGLLLIALLLNACTQRTATPGAPATQIPASQETGAYPAPDQNNSSSAYPAPQSVEITQAYVPQPVPTKAAGTGEVSGTLQVQGTGKVNVGLYLAPLITDEKGMDVVAALDRNTSPHTYSDPQGNFRFYNIPPGKYGLVLDVVKETYLLHEPSSNTQILVTVTEDAQINLGTLNYETLPVP